MPLFSFLLGAPFLMENEFYFSKVGCQRKTPKRFGIS